MKIKTIMNLLTVFLLFVAIWSHEPIKTVLSAILLQITVKFTLNENEIIGKQIIEKNLPITFEGFKNVKFKNW